MPHTQSLIGGCYQQLIVWCQVTEVKCLLCEEPFVRLLSAMVTVITWKTPIIEIPRHGVSGGWLLEWWATLNLRVRLCTHAALPPHTAQCSGCGTLTHKVCLCSGESVAWCTTHYHHTCVYDIMHVLHYLPMLPEPQCLGCGMLFHKVCLCSWESVPWCLVR